MADIFISYIRENVKFVRQLAQSLMERGITAWYYIRDNATPGGDFYSKIAQEIKAAGAFLVVLCPRTLTEERSIQVHREITCAADENRAFLPILLNAAREDVKRDKPGWVLMMASAVFYQFRRGRMADLRAEIEKRLGEVTNPPCEPRTDGSAATLVRTSGTTGRLEEPGAIHLIRARLVRIVNPDGEPVEFHLTPQRATDLPPAQTLDQALAWKTVHLETEKLCRGFFRIYAHLFACRTGERSEELLFSLAELLPGFSDSVNEFYDHIQALDPAFHRIPVIGNLMRLFVYVGAITRALTLTEDEWATDRRAIDAITDGVRQWILAGLRMADEKLLDYLQAGGGR